MRGSSFIAPWIAQSQRPWVVVDWNVIRSLPAGVGIPGTFSIAMTDAMMSELTESNSPQAFIQKLANVLRLSRGERRILVGKHWADISRNERHGRTAAPGESIHGNVTLQLRRAIAARDTPVFDLDHIPQSQAIDLPTYLGLRREFVETGESFTKWLTVERPDVLERARHDEMTLVAVIRHASIHVPFIVENNRRFGTSDWRRTLSVFPDRAAIGRWTRLVMWYALQHAIGRTKRFENNFDDAHYAFMASYCLYLVTADLGLTRAVQALFPKVRVVPDFASF